MRILGKKSEILYKKHIKTFLNLDGHHDVANVSFNIEVEGHYYDDGTLKISDCNSNIKLQFEINSEEDITNSVHKMNTLLDFIQKSRDILLEAIEVKRSVPPKTKEE